MQAPVSATVVEAEKLISYFKNSSLPDGSELWIVHAKDKYKEARRNLKSGGAPQEGRDIKTHRCHFIMRVQYVGDYVIEVPSTTCSDCKISPVVDGGRLRLDVVKKRAAKPMMAATAAAGGGKGKKIKTQPSCGSATWDGSQWVCAGPTPADVHYNCCATENPDGSWYCRLIYSSKGNPLCPM